jgi:anhydro-N-acetylmuramic acid kinase
VNTSISGKTYFLGLMSGTSMDSIDAVAMDFHHQTPSLVATHQKEIPASLKQKLLELCQLPQQPLLGELDSEIGELFALTALELLHQQQIPVQVIRAIGSHGQTVYHQPPTATRHGYSQQIGDPNIIALRTGITTVADFRRKDMAAGGQGAPLVPAFHREVFCSAQKNRVIANIGGMANITVLPIRGDITGFDTGPGNVLLDAWIYQQLGKTYDAHGAWARQGKINTDLLSHFLADDFFKQPPPKSTGREHFNLHWLEQRIAVITASLPAPDVQATLTALTARSIADAIHTQALATDEIFVCGGGAHNTLLMQLLRDYLRKPLSDTSALGIAPDWVEAAAFAWLAKQTLEGKPGNLPSVTGAKHPVVLGGIYPP